MDKNISIEDLNFFREMLESGENRLKNYSKLIKNRNSRDFKRFIYIYQILLHSLSEKEKYVLDLIYGINDKPHTLKEISQEIGLSPSRIRQIRVGAERKLKREMVFLLHPERRNQKYFSEIITKHSDEILLKIGQATRPWEPFIKQYFDKEPTKSRRKRLENIIDRIWFIGALDHREKTLEILNVREEDVVDY